MKTRQRAHSPSMKKSQPSKRRSLKQIEEQIALLLVLLEHNIDKVLHHKRAR